MLLSQTAEYAFRAMYQLARLPTDERIRAIDLSESAEVPAPYLAKVMGKLVKAGLVDGLKGHHGGFRLARPPSEITYAEILGAIEDWESMERRCFFGWPSCNPLRHCPLHNSFAALKACNRAWADSHRLSELALEEKLTSPIGFARP